jgi:hypothetical protein
MRKLSLLVLFVLISSVSALAQTSGGLKGRVRSQSGSGIGGASIVVRQNGEDLKSVTADGKGNFQITGLATGRYNLVFEANGYATGVLHNVEVRAGKVRELGERLILSTDQGTLVIIKGSVFYKEGTSLMGAKVELEKVNGNGAAERVATAYSTPTGEFTFRRPQGAGKYRVTAKFKDKTASKEVEVDMAAIYRLAITLDISRADQ